jgi:alkaline phosphatase
VDAEVNNKVNNQGEFMIICRSCYVRRTLPAIFLLMLWSAFHLPAALAADRVTKKYKNVIILIADGCNIAHFTIARWCKGAPLACDALHVAQVRTHASSAYVTDSAPAATAMACGFKTHDSYIGVLPEHYTLKVPEGLAAGCALPDGWANRPIASVLEGARLQGKATGVVVTYPTSNATPAGFTAHWYKRGDEKLLMEQQVYQDLDVLMGGGRDHLTKRPDGEDLLDTLRARGYRIIDNRDSLLALPANAGRVWAHFNPGGLGYDYDRVLPGRRHEPSLEEMTRKALELLSANSKSKNRGFFLMVEGSQVDGASHANDPVGVVSEYLAFDRAVQAVVDFARADKQTLVLVVSDHDNGGMAMHGKFNLDMLKRARLSGSGISIRLGQDPAVDSIQSVLAVDYAINDLTAAEIETIRVHAGRGKLQPLVAAMFSKRCGIGWTTGSHTGTDVMLYYYGPDDHLGVLQNSDIAHISAQAMGFTLQAMNDSLFQDAAALLDKAGPFTIDTVGVAGGGGSLTVGLNGRTGVFPFNKNEVWLNGAKKITDGVTVYSYKNGKVYLPAMARRLFK